LFLSLFWAFFFLAGFCGAIFMIYQTVEQFLQYDVITMTKITRKAEIIFPVVTICFYKYNPLDMIVHASFGRLKEKPQMTNLTLYSVRGSKRNCLQLNYIGNKSKLAIANGEGKNDGYELVFFCPLDSYIRFAITDNGARVTNSMANNYAYPGLLTQIILSKTNQTSLGPPYSECNDTVSYKELDCVDECIKDDMTELCGCRYPQECGVYDIWPERCQDALVKNYSSIQLQCRIKCPAECRLVNYPSQRLDVDIPFETFSTYKKQVLEKFNVTEISDDDIKAQLIHLYFYFDQLETTEITQSPSMSIIDLIASFGGHLGKLLYLDLINI